MSSSYCSFHEMWLHFQRVRVGKLYTESLPPAPKKAASLKMKGQLPLAWWHVCTIKVYTEHSGKISGNSHLVVCLNKNFRGDSAHTTVHEYNSSCVFIGHWNRWHVHSGETGLLINTTLSCNVISLSGWRKNGPLHHHHFRWVPRGEILTFKDVEKFSDLL